MVPRRFGRAPASKGQGGSPSTLLFSFVLRGSCRCLFRRFFLCDKHACFPQDMFQVGLHFVLACPFHRMTWPENDPGGTKQRQELSVALAEQPTCSIAVHRVQAVTTGNDECIAPGSGWRLSDLNGASSRRKIFAEFPDMGEFRTSAQTSFTGENLAGAINPGGALPFSGLRRSRHALKRARPFWRRRRRIARPLRVFIRARKPILRLRFRVEGW